ncbi:MAG: hypothetical protein M3O34_19795 [Chloroflexota bacterium]|nr:hypothetical protein [Chloroflexota bacterium]
MQLFGSRTGETTGPALRRQLLLWSGALGGAVAWSLHLLAIYGLLPLACAAGSTWPIHVVTLLTAAATLGACAAALAVRRRDGATPAERWMALASLLLDGLFFFSIVVEGLPALILGPCL